MHVAQREHGVVVMRVGITGTGVQPNYRLEDAAGHPFVALDGANHLPWLPGARFDQPANWSTATMSYAAVQDVIARMAGAKTMRGSRP